MTKEESFQVASRLLQDTISGKNNVLNNDTEERYLERCICLDANGKVVGYNVGGMDRVAIKPDAGVSLRGCTVIHSHSAGDPLSAQDVKRFFEEGLREITAVTPFGRYRMIRTKNDVNMKEIRLLISQYKLFSEKILNDDDYYFKLDVTIRNDHKRRAEMKIGRTLLSYETYDRYECVYDALIHLFNDKAKVIYE